MWLRPHYRETSARGTGDEEHGTELEGRRPLKALTPSVTRATSDTLPHGLRKVILVQPLEWRPREVVICPKPLGQGR